MFDSNILEQDIERLAKNVKEKIADADSGKEISRETVKEAMRPMIMGSNDNDDNNNSNGSGDIGEQQMILQEKEVLPDYMKDAPESMKLAVEQLIDYTFKKGIAAAAKEAQKRGAFVMDAYHDALTDKLYGILKERELI